MEKISIRELKDELERARQTADPVEKDMLWRLHITLNNCPPQYLRLTKMYEAIKNNRKAERNGTTEKVYSEEAESL